MSQRAKSFSLVLASSTDDYNFFGPSWSAWKFPKYLICVSTCCSEPLVDEQALIPTSGPLWWKGGEVSGAAASHIFFLIWWCSKLTRFLPHLTFPPPNHSLLSFNFTLATVCEALLEMRFFNMIFPWKKTREKNCVLMQLTLVVWLTALLQAQLHQKNWAGKNLWF